MKIATNTICVCINKYVRLYKKDVETREKEKRERLFEEEEENKKGRGAVASSGRLRRANT